MRFGRFPAASAGELHLDENWQKQPLQIGQKKFQHGLWVHADSELCYALDGKYQRFEAWMGLDAARPSGAARFFVRFSRSDPLPTLWQSLHPEVRDLRHAMLLGLRGMKEFLAGSRLVDLEKEWECQYWTLEHDLQNRGRFARFAAETHNAQSLLAAEDRDPADIVLRRTAALLGDLKRTSAAAALPPLEKELGEFREANGRIPAGRRRCPLRPLCRRLPACGGKLPPRNPLLNFDQLLFLKHHRSNYNHMCDQYYGVTATARRRSVRAFASSEPRGPRCAMFWPARRWRTDGSRV